MVFGIILLYTRLATMQRDENIFQLTSNKYYKSTVIFIINLKSLSNVPLLYIGKGLGLSYEFFR